MKKVKLGNTLPCIESISVYYSIVILRILALSSKHPSAPVQPHRAVCMCRLSVVFTLLQTVSWAMLFSDTVLIHFLSISPIINDPFSKQFTNTNNTVGRYRMCLYPEVGPGLGHLQFPVVLPAGEALKAEHLPGVVKAGLVTRHGPGPRRQVLRPPVLQRQRQVPVGRAGVKGQRASVCNDKEVQTEI